MLSNSQNAEKLDLEFDAWKLQSDDQTEVIQLHIPAGGVQATHPNPVPVIFYVLEGNGVITIGKVSMAVSVGDLIEVNPGEERGWKNIGTGILKLLVIKKLPQPPSPAQEKVE